MFTYRILAYKDKNTYTGVCLDLDIVEEGHTSLEEARLSIQEAVEVYLESVLKTAAEPSERQTLLFRPAPREYWEKAKKLTLLKPEEKTFSQIPPFLYYSAIGPVQLRPVVAHA